MAVDLLDPEADLEPVVPPPATNGATAGDVWRIDKQGREYIPRPAGKSGIIYRQGDETIDQGRERDAKPKDERPRRRTKRPKMPPAPSKIDLKELEKALTEALKSPAIVCSMYGDEWAADHFTNSGPYLARNLIMASEHNPWLRRKLEDAATGQDAAMKLISLVGVGGALAAYAIPPVVYFLNLPAPDKMRRMWGIPDRREPVNAPAASPPAFADAA